MHRDRKYVFPFLRSGLRPCACTRHILEHSALMPGAFNCGENFLLFRYEKISKNRIVMNE